MNASWLAPAGLVVAIGAWTAAYDAIHGEWHILDRVSECRWSQGEIRYCKATALVGNRKGNVRRSCEAMWRPSRRPEQAVGFTVKCYHAWSDRLSGGYVPGHHDKFELQSSPPQQVRAFPAEWTLDQDAGRISVCGEADYTKACSEPVYIMLN